MAADLGPLPRAFAQFQADKDGRQDTIRLTLLPPGQVYESEVANHRNRPRDAACRTHERLALLRSPYSDWTPWTAQSQGKTAEFHLVPRHRDYDSLNVGFG